MAHGICHAAIHAPIVWIEAVTLLLSSRRLGKRLHLSSSPLPPILCVKFLAF